MRPMNGLLPIMNGLLCIEPDNEKRVHRLRYPLILEAESQTIVEELNIKIEICSNEHGLPENSKSTVARVSLTSLHAYTEDLAS